MTCAAEFWRARLIMRSRLLCLSLVGFVALLEVARGDLVISEIQFHPQGIPEPIELEFIEILNTGPSAISLSGARIDRGVDMTFPNISIPRGGRIVAAADEAALRAAFPGLGTVLGGWSGRLSNTGEEIRIVDAAGETLASVRYSTEGTWARRVRETQWGGWDWQSLADGGGPSLELIDLALPSDSGQNWQASTAPGGTPGGPNSAAAAETAPVIENVKHDPPSPTSGEPIRVTCRLHAASGLPPSATVFWRESQINPGEFAALPMTAGSAGELSATIPGQPNGTILEFYVRASQGAAARTFPGSTSEGQNANCLVQVDDTAWPADIAEHRLILTTEENNAFSSSSSGSNRTYNVTLVTNLGSGPKIRYQCGMRIRGASSRTHQPRPMRFAIPDDSRLEGIRIFNLNPRYTYLQVAGAKLFQAAGLRAPDASPVRVRRNGVATERGDFYDYGLWAMVEHLDSDFVDRHWPEDSGGNLYKKSRPDNGWAYRNGDYSRYATDGFSKETNSSADDWTDLDELLGAFAASPAAPDYFASIDARADIDQWLRWFAVQALIANGETNASNGADDDYSFYRGEMSGKFEFIPHDLDTILSIGDGSTITNPEHTVFDMIERGAVLNPLPPFFAIPSIRQRYFEQLQELAETVFAPSSFDPFIDNLLGDWVAAGRIDAIKAFMSARRDYVLDLVEQEIPSYTPVPALAIEALASPRLGDVVISEILARNVAAVGAGADFPDLIELRNYGTTEVTIGGMSLTDDPSDPRKFVIAAGTAIPAGGFWVAAADDSGAGLYPALGFGLSQYGDQLLLFSATGALVDEVAFGPQAADFSIGRTGADGSTWTLCFPTFGSSNTSAATDGPAALRINEWLTNPDFMVRDDILEVYHPGTRPAAIGGMSLTDDAINYPDLGKLPALSFLSPQSYTVFKAVGSSDASPGDGSELPFRLSATGSRITLLAANGVRIDSVFSDFQFSDQSRGRSPDGSDVLADFLPPTPGLPNVPLPSSAAALLDGLRISEICFHPPGGGGYEFIELTNISDVPLDLAGIEFTNGISFTFPSMTLAPGAYAVLVRDLPSFESRYGSGRPVAGVFGGALDNSGERITLALPDPIDLNVLSFQYDPGWFPETAGGGRTLEAASVSGTPARNWGERATWQASTVEFGSPGLPSPPVLAGPYSASGTVAYPFSFTIPASGDPREFGASGLPAGLSVDAEAGVISGMPQAAGQFAVTISASNAAGTAIAALNLIIASQPRPEILSPLSAVGAPDIVFRYQIAASENPTSYFVSGGPAWLALDSASGVLSGTPPATADFTMTIGAVNPGGSGTALLRIVIVEDQLAMATDFPGLIFTTSGDAPWFSQAAVTRDGVDAAESGDISDSESSSFATQIDGPVEIAFWWKVSSESGWDYLSVYLDGSRLHRISGEVGWTEIRFQIPDGLHTVEWEYDKDGSVTRGSDAGWVDELRLIGYDSDRDGLPDDWEQLHFGGLDETAFGDFDGDGVSNAGERAAGTIPSDPRSKFAILSLTPVNGESEVLAWQAVPGRRYQLQRSRDFVTWSDFDVPITANQTVMSAVVQSQEPTSLTTVFVDESTPVRGLIPATDPGPDWRGGSEAAFAAGGGDSEWLSGVGGVGYESSPADTVNFLPYIGLDVFTARNFRTSVYARYRFSVADPASVSNFVLRMRVDDGFVAWINGQRIASLRDPSFLTWNSRATNSVSDNQAVQPQVFPVSLPPDALRAGENVLAIQIMNSSLDSSDLLAQPVLEGSVSGGGPVSAAWWRIAVLPE